jgi:hypothetical protein
MARDIRAWRKIVLEDCTGSQGAERTVAPEENEKKKKKKKRKHIWISECYS